MSLLSISKFDERSAFLYVLHSAEDFQIYFCTEIHCRRSVLVRVLDVTQLLWPPRGRNTCDRCPKYNASGFQRRPGGS